MEAYGGEAETGCDGIGLTFPGHSRTPKRLRNRRPTGQVQARTPDGISLATPSWTWPRYRFGVTGYRWLPAENVYVETKTLYVGGAVWIYSSSQTHVTLTAL